MIGNIIFIYRHNIVTVVVFSGLVFLLCLTSSCKKDWFEAKTDINRTVPTTLQDFEYLLDNFIVMNNQTPGLAEVGSDGHFMHESRWIQSVAATERNTYTWTKNLPNLVVLDWNESYKRIFQCNLVLDGLEKKASALEDPSRYNQIKGNALFHRAKNYYDLAQLYAQPYNYNTASSDLGIPLKDGIDVTEPATRTSVAVTYKQILSDLHAAVGLLQSLPVMKWRASKTAAFALLARTYLTMGDFVNAGINADSSLKLYDELLDLNTILPTATNLGQFNIETIFFAQRVTLWGSTFRANQYSVDPQWYSLYDNNDLRKVCFFRVTAIGIEFKGNYNNSDVGFNGLAVDEQYLIRAECYARAGNTTAAMKDLNDLRKAKWSNTVIYPQLFAINPDDALNQVLLERKKELLFRNLRWTDLRRLNLDDRFKITLSRTIGGNTYTLEPDSYRYTLPIPDDVLNFGSQIKQTPGWE